MSYLPSPFTGYFSRVDNTVISGNQLLSYLSGADIRQLEFDANVHSPPALVASATPGTAPTIQQWMWSTISSLSVQCSTGSGIISLGTDSQSQAEAWVAFFNLQSTNDVRVIRMHVESEVAGSTTLATTGGTSDANIQVQLNGGGSSYTQNLFVTANGVGSAQSGVVGAERIILVSANDLNSGSVLVQFNILGNSM